MATAPWPCFFQQWEAVVAELKPAGGSRKFQGGLSPACKAAKATTGLKVEPGGVLPGCSLVHQGAQRVALQPRPQLSRHPPVEEGGVGGGGGAEGEGCRRRERSQDRRRRAALALQAAPSVALHPGIHRGDDVLPPPRPARRRARAHAARRASTSSWRAPGRPWRGGLKARLQPGPVRPSHRACGGSGG